MFDDVHRDGARLVRRPARSTACESTIRTDSPTRPATCSGSPPPPPAHGSSSRRSSSRARSCAHDWPVDGTTGYDALNSIAGLFVDPRPASARSTEAVRRRSPVATETSTTSPDGHVTRSSRRCSPPSSSASPCASARVLDAAARRTLRAGRRRVRLRAARVPDVRAAGRRPPSEADRHAIATAV